MSFRTVRVKALVSVLGLFAAASMVSVSPAMAAEDQSGPDIAETAAALDAAGSLVNDAAQTTDTAGEFIAAVAGSEVELPADPAEALVLDRQGNEVSVELPSVDGMADGVLTDSGMVVYESDASPVSFAAQATRDGGLQVLIVIDGPEAPRDFSFDLTVPEGASLVSTPDGGAVVRGADGSIVSTVSPPWAVDAAGASVPTHYVIDGTTLRQVVDHAGFSYPVVADPCFWGWKCLKKIVSGGASGAAAGAVTGCVMGALPTAMGGGFGCLPGAAGGAIAGTAGGAFLGWWSA